MGDLEFYANVTVAGLAIGAVYALYGLGITMIYKATRVPNFAHAAIGMFGAYVFFKLWDQASLRIPTVQVKVPFGGWAAVWDPPALPLVVALVIALAVTGLLGLAIEKVVMRRLVGAPQLNLIIVSVALLAVLTGLASDLFSQEQEFVPSLFPEGIHSVAGVNFANRDLGIFVVTIVLAVALAAFFRFATLGVAIRATADSREVARLLGIDANRVAGFSWAVGSMLAAIAGVLISPNTGLNSFVLASLIVYGFTASLMGGFTSLVGTLAGGLLLGVAGNLVRAAPWPDGFLSETFSSNGAPAFVTLMLVIGILMLRPRFIFKGIRLDEDTGVAFARTASGLNPEDRIRRALDRGGALRILLTDWRSGRVMLAGVAAVALLGVPVFTVSYWSTVLAFGVIGALIALNVIVLTGWTGQLSLAPLTFLGIGGYATAILTTSLDIPFFFAIPAAGLITIPFAVVIGLPALRLKGFFFALTTLAFALAAEQWLFTHPMLTNRSDVDRGLLPDGLTEPVYYLSLLVAVGLFLTLRALQRTRVARTFHALRDSETTAVALGIDPVRYKLLAFALSGFIGGVAGALLGFLNPTIQPITYAFALSLTWVLNTVVSGVTVLAGAVAAGLFFSVVPQLVATPAGGANQAPIILGGILAILTVTDYPNGFAAFLQRLVRPFNPAERVAWASDDVAEAPVGVAVATDTDDDEREFEVATRRRVAVAGGGS